MAGRHRRSTHDGDVEVVAAANDDCWCGSGKKYKRCHRAALLRPGVVGPWRDGPAEIVRPDYVETGNPVRTVGVDGEVRRRDRADARRGRDRARRAARRPAPRSSRRASPPTRSTASSHEAHIARNVYPSPLGYKGFPKSVCTSVNEVICHGIPDDRPLADGDIVNVDVTVYTNGVHGDTSATFLVGRIDPVSKRLVRATSECLDLAIDVGSSRRAAPRHRPRDRDARARPGLQRRAVVRRSRHRRGVPRPAAGAALLRARGDHDHGARHGVHHRAHDHDRRHPPASSGTTTGPRSPPTARAARSSSTPSSSPTPASTSSPAEPLGIEPPSGQRFVVDGDGGVGAALPGVALDVLETTGDERVARRGPSRRSVPIASASASTSSTGTNARRVTADLAQRGDVAAHHQRALRHRLEHRDPEPLVAAREHEQVGARVEGRSHRARTPGPATSPGRRAGGSPRRRRRATPLGPRARAGAARRIVETSERVEQHAHVLARLERADPEHVRPVVDAVRIDCTCDRRRRR